MRWLEQRAILGGLASVLALMTAIYFGSSRMKHFDSAVAIYVWGSLAAAFVTGYRLTQFCSRPPTWRYLARGWQLFWKGGALHRNRNMKSLVRAAARGRSAQIQALPVFLRSAWHSLAAFFKGFVLQSFVRNRSWYRWIMHLCLSGGGTLAFAITFPLVFGWVHFESLDDNAEIYRAMVFGISVHQFGIHGIEALLIFNFLNIAALVLLVGLGMAVTRRLLDAGEQATQSFRWDFLPLVILAVVTITGLLMSVSYKFLSGRGHGSIGTMHAISVVVLLLYIPFGKLFHILQRWMSLAVALHKRDRASTIPANCRRCGTGFASIIHVEDLKTVLDHLGFNYRFATARGELHYQEICPGCRRKLFALNQGRPLGR